MAEKLKGEGGIEKGAKWYRNWNYLSATAFTGAGVYLAPISPELSVVSFGFAAFDVAQSGVAEYVRRWRANSGKKPSLAPA